MKVLSGTVPSSEPMDTRLLDEKPATLPAPPLWTLPVPLSPRFVYGGEHPRHGSLHIDLAAPNVDHIRNPFEDPGAEQGGGWANLGLRRALDVVEGQDVVLGVEFRQEPWECPVLVSGPFETSSGQSGSYFQLVRYEIQTADGGTVWRALDCNGNGLDDEDEGIAFGVSDTEARSRCGLRFPYAAFQWKIRAVGPASEPSPKSLDSLP